MRNNKFPVGSTMVSLGVIPLLSGCLLTGGKHVTAEYSRQVTVASARAAQVEGHLEHLESRCLQMLSNISLIM